jgi:hypothetical protein
MHPRNLSVSLAEMPVACGISTPSHFSLSSLAPASDSAIVDVYYSTGPRTAATTSTAQHSTQAVTAQHSCVLCCGSVLSRLALGTGGVATTAPRRDARTQEPHRLHQRRPRRHGAELGVSAADSWRVDDARARVQRRPQAGRTAHLRRWPRCGERAGLPVGHDRPVATSVAPRQRRDHRGASSYPGPLPPHDWPQIARQSTRIGSPLMHKPRMSRRRHPSHTWCWRACTR